MPKSIKPSAPIELGVWLELYERLVGSSNYIQTLSGQKQLNTALNELMHEFSCKSSQELLQRVESDDRVRRRFVHLSTNHTTSWFREEEHFRFLKAEISSRVENYNSHNPLKVWIAACSTGEEAYSIGLILESLRFRYPSFEYQLLASDIDEESISFAEACVYPDVLQRIGPEYHFWFLKGSGPTEGYMTIDSEIRKRIKFQKINLSHFSSYPENVDVLFCRNVLIYFHIEKVNEIFSCFQKSLRAGGLLFCSSSDPGPSIGEKFINARSVGVFSKLLTLRNLPKLLIVDDEPSLTELLAEFAQENDFLPVCVHSVDEAVLLLEKESVDFIFLDMLMPNRLGPELLLELERRNLRIPTFIITGALSDKAGKLLSSLTTSVFEVFDKMKALDDVTTLFAKAKSILGKKSDAEKVPASAKISHVLSWETRIRKGLSRPDLILAGASTGGIEVLESVFANFPTNSPPVLIVQHISHNFLRAIAERIAQASGLKLGEFRTGTPLENGTLYMPHYDSHIAVYEKSSQLYLRCDVSAPIQSHRPSVDHLFHSALSLQKKIHAALFTGMGRDGALGIKELSDKGHFCMTQSEASCVVYGMPGEADKLGASDFSGSPFEIRAQLLNALMMDSPLSKKAG